MLRLTLILAGILVCVTLQLQAQEPSPSAAVLQDTLYVVDSLYIEIRLDEQMLYLYRRHDSTYIYPCSTGDPALKLGIATREGIFSIKWKAPEHQSSRFDVPMYYWMPFDGGIGIHALSDNAYYWYLGSEPSSHGCVRVSREGGKELFSLVPVGTAVYVHSGQPARELAFADSTMPNLRVMKTIDVKLLARRLQAVQKGNADDPLLAEKLALPPGTVFVGAIGVE